MSKREKDSNVSDKPQTFAERIAEARIRACNNFCGLPGAEEEAFGIWDAAVAVCEAEIAEKNAEIARLEATATTAKTHYEEAIKWRLESAEAALAEKAAEIARVREDYESACRARNALRERLNVAESRTVTDARRKLNAIRAEHYQDSDGRGCAVCGAQDGYWPCRTRLICDEQPAAEGASP